MRRHRSHLTGTYLSVLVGEAAAAVLGAVRGIAGALASLLMVAIALVGALAIAFGLGLVGVLVAMGGVRFEPVIARWWPFPFPPPGTAQPVPVSRANDAL